MAPQDVYLEFKKILPVTSFQFDFVKDLKLSII